MKTNRDRKLMKLARTLRKNETDAERKLWNDFLRQIPEHFYRQKVIGHYIVDFYCPKARLAVELDGSQHYEQEGREKDAVRSEYLNAQGINVVRYSNADINERFEGVCGDILQRIRK